MEHPHSYGTDGQIFAGAARDARTVGSASRSRVPDRWAAAGWTLAGLVGAAGSLFMVMSRQDPNAGSSGSSAGGITVYSTTVSFDAWGRSTVVASVATGSPTNGITLSPVEVPGGPNYGIVLCAAAVMLLGAAISTALPGRFGLPRLLRGLGPVGAGILVGVAACQFLAFAASSRPFVPSGVSTPIVSSSAIWQLGLCPSITAAAALAAAATWLFMQVHSNDGRALDSDDQPRSSDPGHLAPADPADVAPLDPPRTLPPTPDSIGPDLRLEEIARNPQRISDSQAAFRRPPDDIREE